MTTITSTNKSIKVEVVKTAEEGMAPLFAALKSKMESHNIRKQG